MGERDSVTCGAPCWPRALPSRLPPRPRDPLPHAEERERGQAPESGLESRPQGVPPAPDGGGAGAGRPAGSRCPHSAPSALPRGPHPARRLQDRRTDRGGSVLPPRPECRRDLALVPRAGAGEGDGHAGRASQGLRAGWGQRGGQACRCRGAREETPCPCGRPTLSPVCPPGPWPGLTTHPGRQTRHSSGGPVGRLGIWSWVPAPRARVTP